MRIDNELVRSLCDHPATGPRLVEYLVTGEWAKAEAGKAIPPSWRSAVGGPGGPAGAERHPDVPPAPMS